MPVQKKVDVVMVGAGWTAAILAWKLTEAGLRVVSLEQGPSRWTDPDFLHNHDSLRYHANPGFGMPPNLPEQVEVAGVTLPKGTTVKPEHVEYKDLAIDNVPVGAMTRAEDLVGQRLRSRTSGKSPVRKAAVEAPPPRPCPDPLCARK